MQRVQTHDETLTRVNICQFCGKTFKRKAWYLKHSCPKKKKFNIVHNLAFKQAYHLYLYWMRRSGLIKRGKQPSEDSFLRSPYQTSFIKLVSFIEKNNIISSYSYLDWVISTKRPEWKWFSTKEESLLEYRLYMDEYDDPIMQSNVALNTIKCWILEKDGRTPDDFFAQLTPGKILSLLTDQRLMPWIVFGYSPVSEKWLGEGIFNSEMFKKIDKLVGCEVWITKILESEKTITQITEIMDTLWIASQT